VGDTERFHFDTEAPRIILEEAVRAVLVEVLSSRDVDDVFTKERSVIEGTVGERLARELEGYGVGIELVDFSLLDVHAPPEVHPDFRAVAGAAEKRLATILSASAEAVVTRTDAVVEQTRLVNEARAAAESRVREASGASCAFMERAGAFELNPDGLGRHMTLEAAAEVLPRVEKRLVPVPAEELNSGIWFTPRGKAGNGGSPREPGEKRGTDFPYFGMERPE
jgi:regulator of protease activity HflC (stomatin/prohibitin superfamily)